MGGICEGDPKCETQHATTVPTIRLLGLSDRDEEGSRESQDHEEQRVEANVAKYNRGG